MIGLEEVSIPISLISNNGEGEMTVSEKSVQEGGNMGVGKDGGIRGRAGRREKIFSFISEKGLASVWELSSMMGVTEVTIRRDLEALEADGLVERTHGGAVPTKRGKFEPQYTHKTFRNRSQKDVIAQAAAALIEDHDTVFINSGSTTLRIFSRITASYVRVVTNNASFPMEEFSNTLDVIATGGEFLRESYTFVGETAADALGKVYADRTFIGLAGFDLEHGMTTPVQSEAGINKVMIDHTRGKVIVVVDSTKIGCVSNFFVAPAHAADMVITDDGVDLQAVAAMEKAGIQVVVLAVGSAGGES